MEADEKGTKTATPEPTKEPRVRKKMLKNKLMQQMEFYFSDANLRNDKYMLQLLNNDTNNYVLIEEFMSWNRIRSLTTNVRDLAEALENSALLELSTDGLYVHRKFPMKDKENPDACSIYIEQVKSSANHKWLTTVFSNYGIVDYVSIPKYRSGENKGFAFVEFGTEGSAQKALDEFGKADCVIPYTRPGPPLSFALHDKEEETDNTTNKTKGYKASKIKKNEVSCDKNKAQAPLIGPSLPASHFKSKVTEKIDHVPVKMDVPEPSSDPVCRQSDIQNVNSDIQSDSTVESSLYDSKVQSSNTEKTEEMVCESVVTEEQKMLDVSQQLDSVHVSPKRKSQPNEEEPPQKKGKIGEDTPLEEDGAETKVIQTSGNRTLKNQKRKRLKRTWKKQNEQMKDMVKEIQQTGLIIMSKPMWKRLRNTYLDKQRENMKKLKKKLYEARQRNRAKAAEDKPTSEQVQALIKAKAAGTDSQRKLENLETPDYLSAAAAAMGVAAHAASMGFVPVLPAIPGLPGFPQPPTPPPSVGSTSEQEHEKKKEKLPYKQGIVVKIQTADPIYNRKMFKRSVRSVADVKYIEVKEGLSEAYVRCRDPAQATTFIQAGHWMYMNILTGEEEAEFWERYDLEKDAWQRENQRGRYHNTESKHRSKHKHDAGRRGRDKLLSQADKMNIDYTVTEEGVICLSDEEEGVITLDD